MSAPILVWCRAACAAYSLLVSYHDNPDLEWDVVYFLRELCLGRSVDKEPLQTLRQEGLIASDDGVDPVMKAVGLSAVRGEGRHLHVGSPFTDPKHRAVALFLHSKALIELLLPEADVAAVMSEDRHLRDDVRAVLDERDKSRPKIDTEALLRKIGLRRPTPPDGPSEEKSR